MKEELDKNQIDILKLKNEKDEVSQAVGIKENTIKELNNLIDSFNSQIINNKKEIEEKIFDKIMFMKDELEEKIFSPDHQKGTGISTEIITHNL